MTPPRLVVLALAAARALVASPTAAFSAPPRPTRRRPRVVGAPPLRSAPPASDAAAPAEDAVVAHAAAADDDVATAAAASLKTRLFAACAASDRGFAASAADRAEIEALLDDLAPLSPTEEPARGLLEGSDDAPLKACWRLVYTSASDVATLSANPFVGLGGIYQDARELPVIMNVIDTKPRALDNLPPAAAAAVATATRLNVQTRARPRGASRVGLTFESVEVQPLQVLGRDLPSWLPSLKVEFPKLGLDLQRRIFGVAADEDPRDAANNPAFFDVTYLDDDFLVIRQGSPGGVFAAIKVDGLDALAA